MDKRIVKQAKIYMEKLSRGIDPITDRPCGATSELQNERLKTCFHYTAVILEEILKEENRLRALRLPFSLTAEQIEKIQVTLEPVNVGTIAERINTLIDKEKMAPVSAKQINDALVEQGYLRNEVGEDGHTHRAVTKCGLDAGILGLDATNARGEHYQKISFNRDMQKYIVEHISGWRNHTNTDNLRAQKEGLDALGDLFFA